MITFKDIAASGRQYSQPINLLKTRTLSVTNSTNFNASATAGAVLEIYYSPDGINWDTLTYDTMTITLSAGNRVQKSALVLCPEWGYIRFAILNSDATYTIPLSKIWYTIQAYDDNEKPKRE